MKLFLGIDLPEATKKALYEQLKELRKKHPDYWWIDMNSYHLTLHEFGEVKNVEEITNRIKDIFYDATKFPLIALKLDTFVKKQILLYVELRRQKKLEQLVTTLRTDLGMENIPFMPHIMLSKSALSSKQQYYALTREIDMSVVDFEFQVDKVHLFENDMATKHPVYTKIAEFCLID